MHWPRVSVVTLSFVALAACGGSETTAVESTVGPPAAGSLLARPFDPLPARLADVGLFPRAPDVSAVPDGVLTHVPRWPLWSNGGDKLRHTALPEGTRIDSADPAAWRWPEGTLLFKTFSFARPDGGDRPVETRVMRRIDDGWEYAVYLWNDAGDDGDLLDLQLGHAVTVEVDGDVFEHRVPSRLECRQCHESSTSEVLGLEPLQLGPAALQAPWSEVVNPPPSAAVELPAHDAPTSAVLGYFVGNCTHCHNGSGGPSSSFDLRPAVALQNLIDRPTESSASAAGVRVVPGDPEASVLYQAMRGDSPDPELKAMPPVGVERRDEAAIELVRAWVLGLGAP